VSDSNPFAVTSTFGKILPAADIVALVSRYTELTEMDGGNYHVGCCPVHDDTSPSLSVRPYTVPEPTWFCFTCQRGGNIVQFLAWVEGIEFDEALARLATEKTAEEAVREFFATQDERRSAKKRLVGGGKKRVGWGEMLKRLRQQPWWVTAEDAERAEAAGLL
jgi:DNA primase